MISINNSAILEVLKQSKDATAIYQGPELKIVYVNDAMLRFWDRSREIVGSYFSDAFPSAFGKQYEQLLKNVWLTEQNFEATEAKVELLVDGKLKTFYYDFSYRAIHDDTGKIYCILHTANEVSDRKTARELVQQKELEEFAIREELQQLNEELEAINEEYQSSNEELNSLNKEYAHVNEELRRTNAQVATLSKQLDLANTGLLSDNNKLRTENDELIIEGNKLVALFEDAPTAIGMLNGPQLVIDSANQWLLALWGKDESVIGRKLEEALPELEGQPFLKILQDVFRTGQTYKGVEEKASLMRNGIAEDLYFNFIYKPLKGKDKKTYAVMIVAYDVTDQVISRIQIGEAYAQLEFAIEAGKLGSYELDIETGEMTCNENYRRNFGRESTDSFNLQELFQWILPSYHSYVENKINESIINNGLYEAEYQVLWPDGSRHWIKALGKPRYNADGKPVRMVGVTMNITEQKALDQRKDDFLSIASHELKTPITALKANLQLLERSKREIGNPHVGKLIDNSLRNMVKLHDMVDDLLNISRFSEGQVNLMKTSFSLNRLLNECCLHVKILGKRELMIDVEGEVTLEADESKIEQVINNFVNNAEKYAQDSDRIVISTEKQEGFVKVSVRDYGPGIPPEQLPYIFERYWRADHSSRNYTGLGLGLYISSEIIKKHGGEIGAESIIGQGSTFWFTLPI